MHLKAEKDKSGRLIPKSLADSEVKYIYDRGEGKYLYTPIYAAYNEKILNGIIDNTSIKADFEAFKDTGIWERYTLNAAQFSSAKSVAESNLIQAAIMKDGKVQSFSKFEKEANQIAETVNQTWLRTEYELCKHEAVMGENFRRMEQDRDLYPYWVYQGVMDDVEREEHVALEGLVFRIGDPASDDAYPPNGWNCRCSADPVDDDYLTENNLNALTSDQAAGYLESDVDPQFRFNAAIQGTLPNTGSYFEAMGSANEGNASLFNLPKSSEYE